MLANQSTTVPEEMPPYGNTAIDDFKILLWCCENLEKDNVVNGHLINLAKILIDLLLRALHIPELRSSYF